MYTYYGLIHVSAPAKVPANLNRPSIALWGNGGNYGRESDYAIIKQCCALMRLCAVTNDSAQK